MPNPNQILTVAEMRAAEDALIAAGSSVDALMQIAGRGAAEWVWRVAAQGRVTVLCGPGNNGGDGYVIAQVLRERGCAVTVVAPHPAKTEAARKAAALYQGSYAEAPQAEVLVDCLYGSGLSRALTDSDAALLARLSARHSTRIAVDMPSGVDSDSGAWRNSGLPNYDLTLALGAWKPAHFLMPASAAMGQVRLVDIGINSVAGAAAMLAKPVLAMPAADAHKYRRGLLCVVAGGMPGAARLAARAAQGAGAGYVKLVEAASDAPDLVAAGLAALDDARVNTALIGPGLGRDAKALAKLDAVLKRDVPTVLDADALMLLTPKILAGRTAWALSTPHEGELAALEQAFGLASTGNKADRTVALAKASQMVIVAKGPDTVIAAPDGQTVMAPRASSWLSVAGSGDVLAGAIASRLSADEEAFTAACQGVWLHGVAARQCSAAFTAGQLAERVQDAYALCL